LVDEINASMKLHLLDVSNICFQHYKKCNKLIDGLERPLEGRGYSAKFYMDKSGNKERVLVKRH
jgi:hypothetical protein